jgi:hypothetical protein
LTIFKVLCSVIVLDHESYKEVVEVKRIELEQKGKKVKQQLSKKEREKTM